VEDATLGALEERLRYPELLKIKRDFEAKLAEAQAQLAELETQEDVKNYEFPVSRAKDELEEIRPVYDELSHAETEWMSLPGLEQLVREGYFDDDYPPGFWQLGRRLRDWRRVSQVLDAMDAQRDAQLDTWARLGPLSNPDELRAAWRTHREQADSIFPLWEQLTARQRELQALGEEVARLRATPQTLFDEMCAALSDAILDHLDA